MPWKYCMKSNDFYDRNDFPRATDIHLEISICSSAALRRTPLRNADWSRDNHFLTAAKTQSSDTIQ